MLPVCLQPSELLGSGPMPTGFEFAQVEFSVDGSGRTTAAFTWGNDTLPAVPFVTLPIPLGDGVSRHPPPPARSVL